MKHVETDTEHCGTFGGNPLSICACITVLEKILTKEATERLAAKSDETFKAMDRILTDAGIAHTLQHIGPMGSINFGITKCDNYRDFELSVENYDLKKKSGKKDKSSKIRNLKKLFKH